MSRASLVAASLVVGRAAAWPGMRAPVSTSLDSSEDSYVGPACTVGAHNWHPESGDCPNMPQPEPPADLPASGNTHIWPNTFIVDWDFYFVPDDTDEPPYNPLPLTPYNRTAGRTYYFNDPVSGERNMKEEYYSYCIPVFGNPFSSMGDGNHYSCDFLNVGSTNTSYVVLHDDKPEGAPDCCIIGRPFHAPPPDFYSLMPVAWTEPVGDVSVDWFAVYDKDAGIFSYGFETDKKSIPFAFYMKGVPWIANWMWQKFHSFREETPAASVWTVPDSCRKALPCPGWIP